MRFIVLEYHAHPHHGWPELRGWLEEVGFGVTHEDAVTDAHGTAWLVRRAP